MRFPEALVALQQGITPLYAACWKGNTKATELLLAKGANTETRNKVVISRRHARACVRVGGREPSAALHVKAVSCTCVVRIGSLENPIHMSLLEELRKRLVS